MSTARNEETTKAARQLWNEAIIEVVRALRASGDITVRGALLLIEKLGVFGRRLR